MLPAIVILTTIIITLPLMSAAMYLWLPDIGKTGDLALIIQTSVTTVILAVGAAFAAVKFQIFRESAPHVTVSQTVSHRVVGDSYIHLMVTATLHNSSKVKMDFRWARFRLQQIAPITDVDVEKLYSDVFIKQKKRNIQWPVLDIVNRTWEKNGLIVEPGESHQESCEFFATTGVDSILIDSFFYNPRQPAVPEGWGTATVYDIIPES